MMDEQLTHYGIKGMKWGIRRYQKEDGSYTKRGLERYNKAESAYEKASEKVRDTKTALKSGTATKRDYKVAKADARTKRRELTKSYKDLKNDKLADQGKALYRSGKTISGNTTKSAYIQGAIVIGSELLRSKVFAKHMDERSARLASSTVALGATVANIALRRKTNSDNRKLRAYYAHK